MLQYMFKFINAAYRLFIYEQLWLLSNYIYDLLSI